MNSSLKTTNFTEIRDTAEDVRSIYDATIVLNIPNMYQAILRKNDGSGYALHDIRIPGLITFKGIHGYSNTEYVYDIYYMQDEELYMVQFTKDSDFYAFDEYGKHKPIEMEMVNRRGQVAILIVNSFDNPDGLRSTPMSIRDGIYTNTPSGPLM